ncbi:MAG: hypothetical protein FJ096_00790 [Deltaproteobacteria bacterium]|nr:hypothetical protein [Deltaproteobacteria bacterium]
MTSITWSLWSGAPAALALALPACVAVESTASGTATAALGPASTTGPSATGAKPSQARALDTPGPSGSAAPAATPALTPLDGPWDEAPRRVDDASHAGPACERTAMSPRDLAVALARGHVALHATEPEENRLLGAWALAAIEGGRGAQVYAFNFANIPGREGEPMCEHPTAEEHGAPVRLRRFDSPTEGALALWSVLGDPSGPALRHIDQGQWLTFAKTLGASGFHQANGARYEAALPALALQATRTLLPALRQELASVAPPSGGPPGSPRPRRGAYSELPLTTYVSASLAPGVRLAP